MADKKDLIFKSWSSTIPKVVVCDDSVHFDTVAAAVNIWRQKGFNMSDPVKQENCDNDIDKNHIKFIKENKPSQLNKNENGVTDRLFTKYKMYGANIIIKEKLNDKKLLIEHELGHALGLNHSMHSNHVMYHKRKYYVVSR